MVEEVAEDDEVDVKSQGAQARSPKSSRSPNHDLTDVLRSVRPDWTPKDLAAVQEKLGKIHITTGNDLFSMLSTQGPQGLNTRLRDAGLKALKVDTLDALVREATARLSSVE